MTTHKGDMIVAQQDETYVYVGDTGYIVVRQAHAMDEDSVILIDPQNGAAIADAIKGYVEAAHKARMGWVMEEDK